MAGSSASNTINDAFAVVDTSGVEGIRVSSENREVARTDSAGRVLVPDLRSYDVNRLSIDPTDAPADATVPFATREVRPQDRSGVVVRFPVRISHGALLRLVDEAGRPLPVGSVATLAATRVAVPVGCDGEAYVQGSAAGSGSGAGRLHRFGDAGCLRRLSAFFRRADQQHRNGDGSLRPPRQTSSSL